MRITAYSFGSITVDGKRYTKDIIILPDKVLSPWWRKEGHSLAPEDLEEVVASAPAFLVVGTGKLGVMDVPGETVSYLKEKGIELRVAKTAEAVGIFNSASGEKKAAALHLTC